MKRTCVVHFLYSCYLIFAVISQENTASRRANKQNQLEYNAIKKLHIHLDDDKDGDVNISESEEFLAHELQVKDGTRHSKFHSSDQTVSVDDLWKAWQENEVSKWSPDEVVDWLTNVVHLPQYADVFKDNKVDGHYLPRLASPDDDILLNELKILNTIDRKKIALRAMDVVLFGVPITNEQNQLEYNAVMKIHVHLDDDKDGDVDFSESEEFLTHELQVKDGKRHSKFHSGDHSISIDDLWKAWKKSEVSKWSPDEVADWLTNIVHLPQYADVFKDNKIDGHHLPRLASPDDDILLNELKISNTIDRKKIALRAMDVVLFGAPRRHNYWKDLVLGLAVLVAMVGFWFSNVQKRKAQKQMEAMIKDVEFLQDAEKNLTSLQNRLQEAETNHQVIQQEKFQLESNLKNEIEAAKREAQRLREAREDQSEETHTRLKLAEQELIQVREALRKAEKEVEYLSSEMSSSLQKWLQVTYQKEVKNFQYRRDVAMRKMEEAKDACNRLKRKRSSMFGALRLAHDQNIDDVDQRILAARTSLAEVTSELEELQYRWQQIETCCRFDLGVLTSFLSNESTDSPIIQVRLSGKVTSGLGTVSTTTHEPLPVHRVYTSPSLHSADENSYHLLSRHAVKRHSSDPSDNASGRETYERSENGTNGKDSTFDSVDGLDDSTGSTLNGHNIASQFSVSQPNISAVNTRDESKNFKQKNLKANRSFHDHKPTRHSFSNSEDKNTGPKKKWWSRGKKHHSEEGNHETNSIHLSKTKSSMPILSQK